MEARRLAILYSHLCPFRSASVPSLSSIVSPSSCAPQSKETFPHDCVFCQIIRGDSPAFKLYEDDMCLCILDTRPLSPGLPSLLVLYVGENEIEVVTCIIGKGRQMRFSLSKKLAFDFNVNTKEKQKPWHSLIIPKSHFPSLDTTPPSVVAAMCSKVPFISNAIIKVTGADSFNLLVNNGVAAGQVIFHTHIHIIPRKAGDCLWTSESLHRRTLKVDQETSGLANRVRELLLNISEENKDQVSTLS
ncbi:hypothetical protein GOBAR_DD12556 [Gossypium barbadense]|nr:hypothetical protein GOBAR_DD12556 [Gossypium barbadense]